MDIMNAMLEAMFRDTFEGDYDAFATWCEDEGYPVIEF